MKKYLLLASCLFLFGCSEEKVGSKPSTEVVEEVVEDSKEVVKNENDPWTHIDVDVSAQYEDISFHVNKVVVSNEMNYMNEKVKAIGTKWTVTNNSKEKRYNPFLGIAKLITSDGEQTQVDLISSDNIGGEIFEGVTKEGNLTFILERSDVENLDWIKIVWETTDGSIMNMKETEMTINLK